MGQISKPRPVKLFAGVLSADTHLFTAVQDALRALYGGIELHSELVAFDFTRYYEKAMGSPLIRVFYGFESLICAEHISSIKIQTNRIEEEIASRIHRVARPVNIDPGYLEESKVVLASTKNFSHRILISDGIYAEVTMLYADKGWQSLPWTFPDFRSGRYDDFFTRLRQIYRHQLCQLD